MPNQYQCASSAKLLEGLAALLPAKGALRLVAPAAKRVLRLQQLSDLYRAATARPGGQPFFVNLLAELNVSPKITQADLNSIPRKGPVVVVANHPFGFVDGSTLAALLPTIRPDVKVMANSVLSAFPAADESFIYVDPFGGETSKRANQKGIREAIQHLRKGGMLAVFPAGEVAHVSLRRRAIVDPEWSEMIGRILRLTHAAALPIFFPGVNSPLFQLLGLIHPRLRTAMLPYEFFRKSKTEIEVRVGSLIPESKLQTMTEDSELMAYLRHRTYLLRHRSEGKRPARLVFPLRQPKLSPEPIVAPVDPAVLEQEIMNLPMANRLEAMNTCAVYFSTGNQMPNVLREIGRLREITFRKTGEGTGKSIDLDSFDDHYIQLFIWDHESRRLVGAYRIGPTDTIRTQFGKRGLYTNTLFNYRTSFLEKIGPALEMGRSFVREEYQKSYAPLLLLWKGIGAYVARNPQYKILFGPVSISNDYAPMSRQLMVSYFNSQEAQSDLTKLVRARSPFRRRPTLEWEESGSMRMWDIEELSAAVADIETDQKGIPVLLRQYLKLGGKLLGFNVDRQFTDALDGLILVDLTATDTKMLNRYLGKEGAAAFLTYHRSVPEFASTLGD
jgi:putative hemolysin